MTENAIAPRRQLSDNEWDELIEVMKEREITALAGPGARFVLAAFPENERRRPRGMDRPEIERRFGADWELIGSAEEQAVSNRPNDPIFVYELRRR